MDPKLRQPKTRVRFRTTYRGLTRTKLSIALSVFSTTMAHANVATNASDTNILTTVFQVSCPGTSM